MILADSLVTVKQQLESERAVANALVVQRDTALRERDEARAMVAELVEAVDKMVTYSNGVSMALRSPGGRSHSWTLGKIGHLYDQQIKVESVLTKARALIGGAT